MFHLAAYTDPTLASGTVLLPVAAVPDEVIAPAGTVGFLVHAQFSKLMRVAGIGLTLDAAQLNSASLRDLVPLDVSPVNGGAGATSPAAVQIYDDMPIDLDVNEELDAFARQSSGGPLPATIGVWFCDGPVRPAKGRIISAHWTASATLTAGGWGKFTPTLDNPLPAGTFAIVGMSCVSATGRLARLIPRGGPSPARPGVLASNTLLDVPKDGSRMGGMGEFMRFTNVTIPQIEVFADAADTAEEGILDLIQVA